MASYVLRYFFDCGSGICLWSSSEGAHQRFGYPVALKDLHLPLDIEHLAVSLLNRFDASFDPYDPGGPPVWPRQERDDFVRDSGNFLQKLRVCLGEEFHIKDERQIP